MPGVVYLPTFRSFLFLSDGQWASITTSHPGSRWFYKTWVAMLIKGLGFWDINMATQVF
jgi:hypothetical protein